MLLVMLGVVLLAPPEAISSYYSVLSASVVLALLAAMAAWLRRLEAAAVAIPTALALLVALMFASTLWSSASWFTLRDSVTFLCLTIAAWLIVKHTSLQSIAVGVVGAGLLVLAASGVLLIVDPMLALERSAGSFEYDAFQGIYANRNLFGLVLLGCIPAVLAVEIPGRGALVWRALLLVTFVGAIAASRSTTSLIIAILVIIAAVAMGLARRSRIGALAVAGAAIGAAIVAATNWTLVLSLFGKNSTLTGRVEIWAGLIDVFRGSPVIGAGFLREWPGGSTQAMAVAERMNGVHFAHGHNELLSWLAGLGVIGVILVLAVYASNYWAGWLVYRNRLIPASAWLVLTMVMINGRGLTETSESSANGWFLFALVAFASIRYVETSGRRTPRMVAFPVMGKRRDQLAAVDPIAT
ncbi:MAG: O-antigen ligase family protein [Salinibacterium sp.]|nr:O-antigen ligase family protein [Salinibacterium sp.]MBF0673454.1 O-antigen ligase family protein [Salinibacterium sp.]